MHPIFLKIWSFPVFSYGVMVAVGFGLATAFIYLRAPKFNIERDKIIDFAIIMLITGIVGARALYVLLNLDYYRANPYEVLNLSKGGLVWYGAFIPALAASCLYAKKVKLDFWEASDLIAPYIALGQAFGRIGCFLNGCCYGIEAPQSYVCAVRFPRDLVMRHPTQLYSAGALFLIFLILLRWQEKRHFAGEIFLGYLIIYSIKRFLMEFVRGDNPKILLGLTMSQYISIIVFVAALAIFLPRWDRWLKRT